jgi:hypothetical protein
VNNIWFQLNILDTHFNNFFHCSFAIVLPLSVIWKRASIEKYIILILLVASPFIAISRDWKSYILMVLGLAVIIFSLTLRKELHKVLKVIHGEDKESIKDTYVENRPQ